MFQDIQDQSLNKIPISNAKAFPSVNSPNDGGFNSEQNMRWMTKKLATKPFIVGANDEEVNNSFGFNGEAGDGIYMKPGMFSADGYIFKFAKPEEISFDSNGDSTFMMMNTQMIQRFVQELTNQGTSDAIVTDMTLFTFDDYNPSVTTDETTLKANWKEAYAKGYCIGYIWNYYNGTYATALDADADNHTIKYQTNDGMYYESNNSLYSTPTISAISTFLGNHSELANKPFAVSGNTQTTSYAIFYPLFFKDFKKWNKNTSKYITRQRIEFTDIFGFTYFYDSEHCQTRSYPVTTSVYMDMNENKPFVNFNNCDKETYPSNFYDYTVLYTDNKRTKPINLPDSASTYADPSTYVKTSTSIDQIQYTKNDNTTATLFTKVTISDAKTSLPNGSSVTDTLSYYCLNNLPDDNDVPHVNVAFMTSDGSLCPNGIRYFNADGKLSFGTTETNGIEGYLHYCKKYYLIKRQTNPIPNPTEENINAVEISQMLSDSNFIDFYNTYITPAISVYLQITYSSIMENVFLNPALNETQKIKAMGSGNALINSHVPGVTERDFYADFTYTYQKYIKSSDSFVNAQATIQVHKDIDSDCAKSNRLVLDDAYIRVPDNQVPSNCNYYKKPDALSSDITRIPYFVDDPLNYLRNCLCTSSDTRTKISKFNLFNMNVATGTIGNISTAINVTENTGEQPNNNVFMVLDQYLMPVRTNIIPTTLVDGSDKILQAHDLCGTLQMHTMVSIGTGLQEYSLINGLCADWRQNCWFTEIPLTVDVDKDNLNYLKSVDFTDPGYYKGIKFNYKFPQDLQDTDLYLYNLIIGTNNVISAYDLETCTRSEDTTSSKVKHRRESFIHFNKLYGDGYISLEEYIESYLESIHSDIDTVQDEIDDVQDEIDGLNAKIIDSGNKNHLETTLTSGSEDGLTWTVNQDGSITISGQNTSGSVKKIPLIGETYKSNQFVGQILSGISDGTANSYNITTYYSNNGTSSASTSTLYYGSTEISNYSYFLINIEVSAGYEFTEPCTFYPMICTQEDWEISHGYAPYRPIIKSIDAVPTQGSVNPVESGGVYTSLAEDKAALAELVDNGAKNKILVGFTSKTSTSTTPTITNNNDGSITVNGSLSETIFTVNDIQSDSESIEDTRYTLPTGKYVLAETGYDNIFMQVYMHNGTSNVHLANSSKNSSEEFEYTDANKQEYPYICYVLRLTHQDFNSCKFYPMVCTKADWDISHEYEPYRRPYEQVDNAETEDRAALVELVDGGAKNRFLPDKAVGITETIHGRTFTIQSDGGVKVETTGTVDADADFYLLGAWSNTSTLFNAESKTWVPVCNCATKSDNISLRIYNRSTGSTVASRTTTSNDNAGFSFDFDLTCAFIKIGSAQTIPSGGIVVYPMICTSADWAISHAYVPYRPSYQELYEMVLAIQNT